MMFYRALCPHCDRRIARRALWNSARRCTFCHGAFHARWEGEERCIDVCARSFVIVLAAALSPFVFPKVPWTAAVVAALGVAVLWAALNWLVLLPWFLVQEADDVEFCSKCGYDLRATPGRCPECGRARGARHTTEG